MPIHKHHKIPFRKLKELPEGTSYKVVETWNTPNRYYPGETKTNIILEDKKGVRFSTLANRKLHELLIDNQIDNIDEGWELYIDRIVTTNSGYHVMNVDLYQDKPSENFC